MNRTNEPGTCLWCGQKLRRKKVYDYKFHQTDNSEEGKVYDRHGRCRLDPPDDLSKRRESIWEEEIDTGRYSWVVDEWFHSQRCAWRFAQAAAKQGIRFTPTKQEK